MNERFIINQSQDRTRRSHRAVPFNRKDFQYFGAHSTDDRLSNVMKLIFISLKINSMISQLLQQKNEIMSELIAKIVIYMKMTVVLLYNRHSINYRYN
jgi:hypothetical protein